MNVNKIKDVFEHYLNEYGVNYNNGESLGWESTDTQYLRFKILSQIGDLNNKNILDLGCGFGNFFDYLSKSVVNINYTGIDLVKKSIDFAKDKFVNYKNAKFIIGDNHIIKENEFDYILCSGIFAVNIYNAKNIYFSMIKELYNKSKYGFGFNMLNKDYKISNDYDDEIIQFHIDEVINYCNSFCNNIELNKGYLPIDFTIYLYK